MDRFRRSETGTAGSVSAACSVLFSRWCQQSDDADDDVFGSDSGREESGKRERRGASRRLQLCAFTTPTATSSSTKKEEEGWILRDIVDLGSWRRNNIDLAAGIDSLFDKRLNRSELGFPLPQLDLALFETVLELSELRNHSVIDRDLLVQIRL